MNLGSFRQPAEKIEHASDEELMCEFALSGADEAIGELVTRYRRPALAVARTYVHDIAACEDAVQETFISVIRYRHRFDTGQRFAPWFYTLLRNTCIDACRKNKRITGLLDRFSGEISESEEQDHETSLTMRRLTAKLKPEDRRILQLKVVEGMTLPEVADAIGCSLEAAKKRSQRALKRLKDLYVQAQGEA